MERDEIEILYAQYGHYLFKRCRQFLGTDEDAYDALQEVFVRVLRRRADLEDSVALLPWLNRVTTNYCLNVLRYRGYRRVDDAVELERLPDDSGQAFLRLAERDDLVALALSRCPVKLREVAVLYFLEEKNLADVAEETDLSVATVRRRIKAFVERARRELRRLEVTGELP